MESSSSSEEDDQPTQLFFDRGHMFIEYRQKLETVASLTPFSGPPPQPQICHVPPPTTETMDVEEPAAPQAEERQLVTQPPSGTVVYRLFRYLHDDVVSRLLVPYTQLLELIQQRCQRLVPDTERRQSHIQAMLRAYVRRLLLAALALDEDGARMQQVLQQLEELYLWWGGREVTGAKNNYVHVRQLHQLMEATYQESLDTATDKFYQKCADAKRRGRRPGHESANPPHPLNQLKAEYILSHKSAPPVVYDERDSQFYLAYKAQQPVASSQLSVDYYPVFVKLLGVVNECVPSANNHGWFTERARQAVQCLGPRDWPMHGLMQSLLNLQGVLERRRLCLNLKGTKQAYHCAYTGQRLQDGDEVWLLRLLVLCPQRHRVWQRESRQPATKTDDPRLLSSIRCYYIKTRVTGLCSLFYQDFDEAYKQRYPEYFRATGPKRTLPGTSSPRLLPSHRRFLFNPLWLALGRLQRFVAENNMAPMLWDTARRECYATLRQRVQPHMEALGRDPATMTQELHFVVFTVLFGVERLEQLSEAMQCDALKIRDLTGLVLEALLDFTDAMFDLVTPVSSTTAPDSVGKASYSLSRLGLPHTEQSEAVMVVRPLLRAGSEALPLLHCLLALSDRRQRQSPPLSYSEKAQRRDWLEQCVTQHAFLFMMVYDALYQPNTQLDALTFPDALALMQRLGVTLNNGA